MSVFDHAQSVFLHVSPYCYDPLTASVVGLVDHVVSFPAAPEVHGVRGSAEETPGWVQTTQRLCHSIHNRRACVQPEWNGRGAVLARL